ncbi:hypothetical protein HRTV-2_gp36 [Halorubrum virus HRTV-2]|nr:hypothetical protein HRTV-2_gp36 [Halorubrum virus HRTV-2]
MTQTKIENSALSIQLSDTESATVPTGEVWKVTVAGQSASIARDGGGDGSVYRYCKINGAIVASSESRANAWSDGYDRANATANASSTLPFDTVLVEGDTIQADGGELCVTGFVVN